MVTCLGLGVGVEEEMEGEGKGPGVLQGGRVLVWTFNRRDT